MNGRVSWLQAAATRVPDSTTLRHRAQVKSGAVDRDGCENKDEVPANGCVEVLDGRAPVPGG